MSTVYYTDGRSEQQKQPGGSTQTWLAESWHIFVASPAFKSPRIIMYDLQGII